MASNHHVTLAVFDYNGHKLCDFYDNQISAPGQAHDLTLSEDINGQKKLTFTMPYMIDKQANWRWKYIRAQYLMRYRQDETQDWFLITDPKLAKSSKVINGTVECDHRSKILRTKNLYMEFDDDNGIGTAPYLMRQILMGTGWQFDEEGSDIFYENYATDKTVPNTTIKVRSLEANTKQGAYELVANVCKLFNAYPVYDGKNKTVQLHDLNNKQPLMQMMIGNNLTAISVDYQSSKIITRMYVEGAVQDNGDYVGIEGVNPTGLSFLLNFDYYKQLGLFTEAHQTAMDTYVTQVARVRAQTTQNAKDRLAVETHLANLWGESTRYVIWKIVDGKLDETSKVLGNNPSDERAALDTGNTLYVLREDGRAEKISSLNASIRNKINELLISDYVCAQDIASHELVIPKDARDAGWTVDSDEMYTYILPQFYTAGTSGKNIEWVKDAVVAITPIVNDGGTQLGHVQTPYDVFNSTHGLNAVFSSSNEASDIIALDSIGSGGYGHILGIFEINDNRTWQQAMTEAKQASYIWQCMNKIYQSYGTTPLDSVLDIWDKKKTQTDSDKLFAYQYIIGKLMPYDLQEYATAHSGMTHAQLIQGCYENTPLITKTVLTARQVEAITKKQACDVLTGGMYAMKFVTSAGGSIGAKEVAAQAKQEVIDSTQKEITRLEAEFGRATTSDERKNSIQAQIESNQEIINTYTEYIEAINTGSLLDMDTYTYEAKVTGNIAAASMTVNIKRTSNAGVNPTSYKISGATKISSDESIISGMNASDVSIVDADNDIKVDFRIPANMQFGALEYAACTHKNSNILGCTTYGRDITLNVESGGMTLFGTTFTLTVPAMSYGLNQLFKDAIAYAYEHAELIQEYNELVEQQNDIEATFVAAMGDLLKDGCWNDENYVVGQEAYLYCDAIDVLKNASRPQISYSVSLVRMAQAMGYEPQDIRVNTQVRLFDQDLDINDTTVYVKKITHYIDDLSKSSVEISNESVDVMGDSFSSIFSRITDIASLVKQKQSVFERASAITSSGTLATERLEGAINTMKTKFDSAVSNWYTDDNGNFMFEDVNGQSAMKLAGQGWLIANGKTDDGKWNWRTAATGEGIVADSITAGYMSAQRIEAGSITTDKLSSTVGSTLNLVGNTSILQTVKSDPEYNETMTSVKRAASSFETVQQGWKSQYDEWIVSDKDDVSNRVQATISNYMRWDGTTNTLQLGSKDSKFKSKLSQQQLGFYEGDEKVSYIGSKNMFITNARITDNLYVGSEDDGYFGWALTRTVDGKTVTGLGLIWRGKRTNE